MHEIRTGAIHGKSIGVAIRDDDKDDDEDEEEEEVGDAVDEMMQQLVQEYDEINTIVIIKVNEK